MSRSNERMVHSGDYGKGEHVWVGREECEGL